MIIIKGNPSRSFRSIIGKITFTHHPIWDRKDIILVTQHMDINCLGYKACITTNNKGYFFYPDHIYGVNNIDLLHEGDIVRIDDTGNIYVIWEINSTHNAFMITESCNCNCIMCPQPPKQHNKKLLNEAFDVLNLLKYQNIEQICITGGEPTLLKYDFIRFLYKCIQEHPLTHIDILTNGKLFKDREFTKKVAEIASNNVYFCVSLHSDIDSIHDNIVGSKGSFIDTQCGLYNLANYGCKIEIRHVINPNNVNRLYSFSEHIYNYFPFCNHYVFIGMEICGNAANNKDIINLSPYEYKNELCDAVLYLYRRGLPVSIYNIPLCLCRHEVRKFARQSISNWKNSYIEICKECILKKDCSGFFTTSVSLPINHIQPIKENV